MTRQQKISYILDTGKKLGQPLPVQKIKGLEDYQIDYFIKNIKEKVAQAQKKAAQQAQRRGKSQQVKQQIAVARTQARVPQSIVQTPKQTKRDLMPYLKFRAAAMKKGLTENQVKAAYATYKSGMSAQQAIASHQTPAAQARVQAKAQQKRQQAKAQQKRQQVKVQAKPAGKSGKAGKRKKIPAGKAARAQAIQQAINKGLITVKQGKSKPTDYQGTATQRVDKFLSLYKGARVKGRKSRSGASLVAIFNAMQGEKHPYYLYPGYTVQVSAGGGKSGPGIIRAIPGLGATPFNQLSDAKKAEVIRFLGTAKGAQLRSASASGKQAQVQKLIKLKIAG